MPSSCISCCIFHIISILFNCSDTTIRVAKAMESAIARCFAKFALFLEFVPELWIRSLAFSHIGNRAEISHINPRRNCSRQPGSCEKALNNLKADNTAITHRLQKSNHTGMEVGIQQYLKIPKKKSAKREKRDP